MNEDNEFEINVNEAKKEIEINEMDDILKIILLDKEKNKILSKEKYEILINLINNLKDEELNPIFNYMNKINFNLLEIIINGYTEYNFEDKNKENLILENISKCIKNNFNKHTFYLVYNKLSKFFLKHKTLNDLESTKQFIKLFNIWKILYDLKNLPENNNHPSILFYPNLKENKGIKIDFHNLDVQKNHLEFTIRFVRSPILNINKFIDNFSFLKIKDKEFKYVDAFKGDEDNDNRVYHFSEIEQIQFCFDTNKYKISVNDKKVSSGILSFNINTISEIFLLSNFIGEIECIIIENFDENENLDFRLDFKKENNLPQFIINMIYEGEMFEEKENNIFQNNNEIFNNQFVKYNYKSLEEEMKYLTQIEYFGGLNSFIPLFKIIKYKISDIHILFGANKINQKENNEYINKLVIMVIDILKIIIKLICLSEHNCNNFKNIIVPLIGSISEIIHALNNQSNLEAKSLLLKDEIIFILYIVIIFCHSSSNLIKTYENIFEIKNNINNYNFSLDFIIFDLKSIKVDLYWYFLMIFNIVISFLIFFDSKDKIPKEIISQFISIKELLCENESQKIDNFDNILALTNFIMIINYYCSDIKKELLIEIDELKENTIFLQNLIYMTNTVLNMKLLPEITNLISFNENSLIVDLEKNLIDIISSLNKSQKIFNSLINFFKNYKNSFSFFKNISSSVIERNFIDNNMLLITQLIDYHGQYHKLIKELFIFNRLWSNQKLFYKDHFDTESKSSLKYKNINYYTRNFQRPIIYPVLDYKYRYPTFSKFKIKGNNNFYTNPEIEDDYNFNLEIPEIDILVKKYNKEVIDEIEKNENSIYNVCLVKQEYHAKGKIYVFKEGNNLQIYFYCNQFDIENELCCNKSKGPKGLNKDNLCYGSIFKCPEKEKNRIIKISFNNIKMIIKRIYYYRKSAIEIFTYRKSYYFNFYEEKDLNNFISQFNGHFENSFFPIKVKDNLIGYIKGNQKLINEKNNFIDFISHKIYKGQISEMCIFDIIILLNLISNRSYNDLTQYPVFPVLFFYDYTKQTIVERDFKEHIGLQTVMECAQKRRELTLKKIVEDEDDDDDGDLGQNLVYFSTHYSSNVYVSNYMIRLFPYSFCCIELQGDGFDNPNRLFFSLEATFNNIAKQKSDIRELIPEFYYLPEMFLNINCINFFARANKEKVDNVIMIKNLQNDKLKSNENNNFIFVDYMKHKLEHLNDNLKNWVKLIFGKYQRYPKKNKNHKIKYFRNECYIDLDEEMFKKYSNDDGIMRSVEFGLTPLQTIFGSKILTNFHLNKHNYEKLEEVSKKESKKENNTNKNNIKELENKYLNNIDYWEEDLNIEVKIDNKYGKVSVFKNKNLVKEIFDHSDEILDSFYNKRLNMFATTAKDGFICVYMIPNKLICVIRHPNNLYFDKVYLSANPFPSIIAYEGNSNNIFRSYSVSGLLIKEEILETKEDIIINCFFDYLGGAFNDGIMIYDKNHEFIKSYYIPFFNSPIK